MVSQATRQRKGGGPLKVGDAVLPMTTHMPNSSAGLSLSSLTPTAAGVTHAHAHAHVHTAKTANINQVVKIAKVKRNKFGTGPFDENWLNLDCCGLFCASITYLLHMYGVYATCLILIPPWMSTVDENGVRTISMMGHLNRVAFTLVAFLAVSAHFKAMTTDPGAVPPDALPLEDMVVSGVVANSNETLNGSSCESNNNNNNNNPESQQNSSSLMVEDPPQQQPRKGLRLCRRCNSFKPKRAHHCSICRRCIIKMDHHCPWVNNCVGIGNHKYFLLFIFYTCLSCVYSLTLVGMRFFDCLGKHGHIRTHHITCLDKPTQLLSILGLFIEAILFGLFTSCMMFDQAGVVMTKMTHIDRLKGGGVGIGGIGEAGSSALAGVIEVFGLNPKKSDLRGRFRADWLSPFHRTCFPSGLHDEMMGFCKPCGGGRRSSNSKNSSNKNNNKANDPGDTELSPMVRNSAVADIV